MGRPLEKIFGSRIRAKLLGWFFIHDKESFFVRQLSSVLDEDSTNLSRELSNLEDLGILFSAKQGNLKYFSVNRKNAFFHELKGLVVKTVGLIGELRSSLAEVPGIHYAFVFGSYAKGEETADSDIDLLIIGAIDMAKLDSCINTVEKKFGRTINHIVYDLKEFSDKKEARDGFLFDVLKAKKVMLAGDEHELKKA